MGLQGWRGRGARAGEVSPAEPFAWLHFSSSRACCAGFRGIKPLVSRPSHFVCEGQSLSFYSTVPHITGPAVLPVRVRWRAPVWQVTRPSLLVELHATRYGEELSETMKLTNPGDAHHDHINPTNFHDRLGI